jgi:drug/metabolite transporter (DMT)-like permease
MKPNALLSRNQLTSTGRRGGLFTTAKMILTRPMSFGLLLLVVFVVVAVPNANAFSPSTTRHPLPRRAPERPLFFHNQLVGRTASKPTSPLRSSTVEPPPLKKATVAVSEAKANKTTASPANASSIANSASTGTTAAATALDHYQNDAGNSVGLLERILSSYWGVRALLVVIPAIYGTNFALGSSLNEALANPALTTALRMTLASLAVLPWLIRIDVAKLLGPAIFTGLCSATGYIGQSIALDDVDPARVSFLGAAVVVWCPILEAVFDKRPFTAQTWWAAGLCMTGVAILEGVVGSGNGLASAFTFATGDAWAMLQAIGFGTQCYLCSKFITDDNKDQVIPFTAVLVTVTAVTAWIWYGLTWNGDPNTTSFGLSSLQSMPSSVWLALAWTGLISTTANFALEVAALGRVSSSEATVFLSTEPIWAAIFAAVLLGNTMTSNEYVGGSLMILACLIGSVSADDIKGFLSRRENGPMKDQLDEFTASR